MSCPLERSLARILALSPGPDAQCPTTVDEVCQAVREYLDDYDSELERDPSLVGDPHWNLWGWDFIEEFGGDDYFVMVVVSREGLEFACGRGGRRALRDFANRGFPEDFALIVPELVRRFSVPSGGFFVERRAAEAWLGRGLGLAAP
ncbi:MAG: hypothetical protein K2W96_17370 [Gemmataceae bacterium]|nr:hypothetical protein [Gemmataceae bacterium]